MGVEPTPIFPHISAIPVTRPDWGWEGGTCRTWLRYCWGSIPRFMSRRMVAIDGTDGRTDTRPLRRPCTAYYAGSVNKLGYVECILQDSCSSVRSTSLACCRTLPRRPAFRQRRPAGALRRPTSTRSSRRRCRRSLSRRRHNRLPSKSVRRYCSNTPTSLRRTRRPYRSPHRRPSSPGSSNRQLAPHRNLEPDTAIKASRESSF